MPNPPHHPQTVENLHNLSQPSAYTDSLLVENPACRVLCCDEQDSQGHCFPRTHVTGGGRWPEKQTNKVISDRGLNDVKKMQLSDEMSKEATLYREVKESLSGEVTFDLRVD